MSAPLSAALRSAGVSTTGVRLTRAPNSVTGARPVPGWAIQPGALAQPASRARGSNAAAVRFRSMAFRAR